MEEAQWIPYEAQGIPGEVIYVVAPHPDDEWFGCGGALLLLDQAGKRIHIDLLTSGECQGAPEKRIEESKQALQALRKASLEAFHFPDRALMEKKEALCQLFDERLQALNPDTVLLPHPQEAHPDHRGCAEAFLSLLHPLRLSDERYGFLRDLKVGFYEISHPLPRVNLLVDISSVVTQKRGMMEGFQSQKAYKDYTHRILSLNAYRATTLPKATHAEAFYMTDARAITELPLSTWGIQETQEGLPSLSLIIRTHQRPQRLKEALKSVAAAWNPPEEILVVDDGGTLPKDFLEPWNLPIRRINLMPSQGRAQAANAGLKAATKEVVAFLDEDDLVFPEHFQVLKKGLKEGNEPVVYTDALSMVYRWDEENQTFQEEARMITFSEDFDADLLLWDNYIPLNTFGGWREIVLSQGLFREDLDLLEDWEWFIRLSRKLPFRHIRQVTCIYRHFPQGATLGLEPHRNPDFWKARRKIFSLTQRYRKPKIEERVFRRLRLQQQELLKERQNLQGEIRFHQQEEKRLIREEALKRRRYEKEMGDQIEQLKAENQQLKDKLSALEATLQEKKKKIQGLENHLAATYKEIERLNHLLKTVFSSRFWKLREFLKKWGIL